MIQHTIAITEKTFRERCIQWLQIIRFNESGLIINPVGDHIYTIPHLLTHKQILRDVLGRYYNKHILVYVELSLESTEDHLKHALLKVCTKKSVTAATDSTLSLSELVDLVVEKGYEVAFFLSRIEQLYSVQHTLMTQLEILARHHRVSFLYFSEQNLTNQQFLSQHRLYPAMFQNVLFHPYYAKDDVAAFITYNEILWKFSVPSKIKEMIFTFSGGNLWLVRQTLRYFRNTRDVTSLFSHYEILKKATASWNQLFHDEQKVVIDVIFNKKEATVDKFVLDYLLKIGILHKESNGYRLTIPLLEKVINEQRAVDMLLITNNLLHKADVVIDDAFTEKEKIILIHLIENKNTLIKRSEIGKMLWKDEQEFSSWALDQIMSRLRSKLQKLGFPKQMIRTKKGVGYVFTS